MTINFFDMNKKGNSVVLVEIIVVLLGILGYLVFLKKPTTSTIAPTTNTTQDETVGWATYSYKNISFRYPQNWTVVFDSKVANQPNGFDLHVQRSDAGGYAPDGLYLSTYKEGVSNNIPNTKIFSSGKSIQFVINRTTLYADCSSSLEGQRTLAICNKIVQTVMIE